MKRYQANYYFVDSKMFLNKLLAGLSFLLRRRGIIVQKELTGVCLKLSLKPKELEWLLNKKLQALVQQLAEGSFLKIGCSVEGEFWLLNFYSNAVVDTAALLDGLLAYKGAKLEILSVPDWGTELVISIPCQTLNSSHETAL